MWIEPSDLVKKDSAGKVTGTLKASEISVFKVHYVNVTTPSEGYTRTGLQPDALLPMKLANGERLGWQSSSVARSIADDTTQPFYVLIHVPAATAAGTYTGTLRVTGNGDDGSTLPTADIPVSVTVKPLSLTARSLKTSVGISLRLAGYANSSSHGWLGVGSGANRVTETTSFKADQMRGWLQYFSDHRISPNTLNPAWQTGGDSSPPDDSGAMVARDAYLNDYLGTGAATTFAGTRFGFNTITMPEQWAPPYLGNPFASTTDTSKAAKYLSTMRGELSPWLSRTYFFGIDEPAGTQRAFVEGYGALVHKYAPGVKFMVTTEPNRWGFQPLKNVDAYVQPLQFYYRDYAKWVWPLRKSGKEVWIYSHKSTFQAEVPMYLIDKPFTDSRAQGWFAYDTRAAGLLYYSVNRWGSTTYRDPYKDTMSYPGGNGDGSLVYPGYYPALGMPVEGSPPVGSLRMEALRDGLEDYELLKLVEKRAGRAVADYYVSRIIGAPAGVMAAGAPTFPAYKTDPGTYESVKRDMMHRLTATTTYTGIAGSNRYATAIEASKRAFTKAPTVVIATGENWPDALGGAALAGAEGGPILLTMPDTLPGAVLAEILRLKAEKAIVLGGTGAVGDGVVRALQQELGSTNVRRIGGKDRYHTAELVARAMVARRGTGYDGGVFVATGGNFPDALAASPLAAAKGWPILLTSPSGLSGSTSSTMKAMGAKDVFILGGTAVVPASAETALRRTYGTERVRRLAGNDRYATANTVATHGVRTAGLGWDRLAIATGDNFPDALAGGVMQGASGSVLLLSQGSALPASTAALLGSQRDSIRTVRFLGATGALGIAPREQLIAVLR
jgi:putative cell wall-binding protein